MEWQTNSWAGLVLVPPRLLKTTFNNEYNNIIPKLIRAQKAGVPDNERIQYAYEYISEPLTDLFNVSKDVIRKRIERDKLFKPLADQDIINSEVYRVLSEPHKVAVKYQSPSGTKREPGSYRIGDKSRAPALLPDR